MYTELDGVYEESSMGVQMTFTDEDGALVSPITLTWSLCDEHGNIINSRSDVSVATPASVETVALDGDDLALTSRINVFEERFFEASATYNSTLGSGLKLKGGARFKVWNLKTIT